jgi:hypothetical protein
MRLTIESFVFVSMPNARHSQGQLAGAVRSATPTMIELFDDFLDILIELHHVGGRFVALGGHAVDRRSRGQHRGYAPHLAPARNRPKNLLRFTCLRLR